MKHILYIFSFMALGILATSCGTDNYDEPTSIFEGQVVYQGTPLELRGSGGAIELQLYQDGYENHNNISVYVNQNGSFQARLFDGQYKMVTKDKNGPWVNNRDTIVVNVKGKTKQNVEVTPYFLVKNANITMSADSVVSFEGVIEQIVTTSTLASVTLFVGDTQFTDNIYYVNNTVVANSKFTTFPATLSETVNLKGVPKVKAAKHLYGRICVKTTGTTEGIFSKVFKLK